MHLRTYVYVCGYLCRRAQHTRACAHCALARIREAAVAGMRPCKLHVCVWACVSAVSCARACACVGVGVCVCARVSVYICCNDARMHYCKICTCTRTSAYLQRPEVHTHPYTTQALPCACIEAPAHAYMHVDGVLACVSAHAEMCWCT
jgi:hypothetical protein